MDAAAWSFGLFRYDPAQALLLRDGVPVALGRRGLLLLERLLRRRGEVVGKADLVGAAWGDQAVEESNLSVQIAGLRRVLGKDDAGRDWIVTIERVGYRFLPPPHRTKRKGLFSLPLVEVEIRIDLPGSAPVAELETDGMVAALSHFSWLAVCRRGETRREADYRLTGAVQRDSDMARLRLRLIDGGTDRVVWAEVVDLPPRSDGLDPIKRAAAVVDGKVHTAEMRHTMVGQRNPASPYDLFIQARRLLRSSQHDDNARAFQLLLVALESEPENALFLGAAAEALHTRKFVGWPSLTGNDQELRLGFARRAWAVAEDDPNSLALAGNTLFTSGDPETGWSITERAAEMSPWDPWVLEIAGHSHLWLGSLDRAREYYERAIALSPNEVARRFAYAGLAFVQHLTGAPEDALATAKYGYALSPGYSGLHWHMIVANLQLNRVADARQTFATYREFHPHARLDNIRAAMPFRDPARASPVIEALKELELPEF